MPTEDKEDLYGPRISSVETTNMICAHYYKLVMGHRLRLQVFINACVVPDVTWKVISGAENCTLVNGLLIGTQLGSVVVEGSKENFNTVSMKVYIGEVVTQEAEPEGTISVTAFNNQAFNFNTSGKEDAYFELSPDYTGTTFSVKGRIFGFASLTGNDFYFEDGTSRMLVQNTLIDRSNLSVGDGEIVTGVPKCVKYKCFLQLSSLEKCTINDPAYDDTFTSISSCDELEDSIVEDFISILYKPIEFTTRCSEIISDDLMGLYFVTYNSTYDSISRMNFNFENYKDANYNQNFNYADETIDLTFKCLFSAFGDYELIYSYIAGSEIVTQPHVYKNELTDFGFNFNTSTDFVADVTGGDVNLDLFSLLTFEGTGDINTTMEYAISVNNDSSGIRLKNNNILEIQTDAINDTEITVSITSVALSTTKSFKIKVSSSNY